MLKFANVIHQIIFRLEETANAVNKDKKDKSQKFQYRINERANNEIEVIIYNPNQKVDLDFSDLYENLTIEYISEKEYNNEDGFYKSFFDNENVLQGYTYRLENIFDTYKPIKKEGLPPIVGFYSYKGGVGRTTTLACFAAYLARKEGKKVFMLDCDFEAPGFLNFFELNTETASKNGLVEYLLDSQIAKVELEDYVIEISDSYSGGEGKIYAMLAGNLSNEPVEDKRIGNNLDTHLQHYLHGLARLDLANPYEMERQFEALFKNIQEKYNPDVILIDSRTGFSEVFSNLVMRFSDLVVGFFGNNDQNKAGFEFFTQIFQKDSNRKKYVLVNSLLFRQDLQKNFSKKIGEFIEQSIGNENTSIDQPHIFEILNNNQALQEQGINQKEQKPYFINLIDDYDRQFPAYYASHVNLSPNKHFFKFLFEDIMDTIPNEILEEDTIENLSIIPNANSTTEAKVFDLLEKKREILTQLDEQYFIKYNPEYADSVPLDYEFLDKFFYFRTQMFDILNQNKFIIRGYKGTGKTLFYEALTKPDFTAFRNTFVSKAKSYKKFVFIDMVALKMDLKPIFSYFNEDYKRFWTIYSWNTLMGKKKRRENNLHQIISFESQLTSYELTSTNTTNWKSLGEYVKDEHYFVIEKELLQLNKDLKNTETKLLLLFDYLDKLVLPNEWSDKYNPISKLIEHWRSAPYSNIESKFFVRTDLYNRLGGINNFNDLEARVIDFEWKREELFVYFFQILLKIAKQDFYEYAQNVLNPKFEGKVKFYMPLEKIKQVMNTNEDQIKSSLKESNDILKTFVSIFFGEYTDLRREVEKKHLSYNWFFNNLSNANQTFSLRVFIVLIRKALEKAKLDLERSDSRSRFPIISGYFFTNSDIRKEAANAHLKDLGSEEPNLKYFQKFFDDNQRNQEYKSKFFKTLLYQSEMKELLETIIRENSLNIFWRDFLKILEDNGIVRETRTTHSLAYSFAFLYKYAFGLRSGNF